MQMCMILRFKVPVTSIYRYLARSAENLITQTLQVSCGKTDAM